MKKIIHLLAFMLVYGSIFSQQKLHDGIYLVDRSPIVSNASAQPDRMMIQFNPGFVNEDPENYSPLIIQTHNYFPFDAAVQPFIQKQNNQNSLLVLQLTESAKERLKLFTSGNLLKEIVVVVNDQALVIYKITSPVISGLIQITKCNGQACRQILKNIRGSGKI